MLDLKWNNVQPLRVINDSFIVENYIPKENVHTSEIIIGRTDIMEIPMKKWEQIKDPVLPDGYSKKAFAKSYFTTAIYFLKRVGGLSLVANKSFRETIDISHTSSFRSSQTTSLRIENTIEATGNAEIGSLRDMLTTTYSIDRMEEYYKENRITDTKEVYYESTPYAREIVFLDLVKIVALYRKDVKGNTSLLAFDDFLVGTYEKAYDSPHEDI